MVSVCAVIQVMLGAALVGLVLMHSGREAGFGGIGAPSQGGTHIVEKNLTPHGGRRDPLPRSTPSCVPAARVARVSSGIHALVAELVDAPG